MPCSPPPAIGIDIGAERLHVATAIHKSVPVITIELADPDWHTQLIALIPPVAVAAYEPTGWHSSAPIVAALR